MTCGSSELVGGPAVAAAVHVAGTHDAARADTARAGVEGAARLRACPAAATDVSVVLHLAFLRALLVALHPFAETRTTLSPRAAEQHEQPASSHGACVTVALLRVVLVVVHAVVFCHVGLEVHAVLSELPVANAGVLPRVPVTDALAVDVVAVGLGCLKQAIARAVVGGVGRVPGIDALTDIWEHVGVHVHRSREHLADIGVVLTHRVDHSVVAPLEEVGISGDGLVREDHQLCAVAGVHPHPEVAIVGTLIPREAAAHDDGRATLIVCDVVDQADGDRLSVEVRGASGCCQGRVVRLPRALEATKQKLLGSNRHQPRVVAQVVLVVVVIPKGVVLTHLGRRVSERSEHQGHSKHKSSVETCFLN